MLSASQSAVHREFRPADSKIAELKLNRRTMFPTILERMGHWQEVGHAVTLEQTHWNRIAAQRLSSTRRCSEREPAVSLRKKLNVIGGWLPSLTFASGDSNRMDMVIDPAEFKRLEGEALKLKPIPVVDLILDDSSFGPSVVALGDKALGVLVGGHIGFLPFADVPAIASRRVREALPVSGAYASPFIGWWLRRRWAARAGALASRPSWIPAL